jgi:hypothetical protein
VLALAGLHANRFWEENVMCFGRTIAFGATLGLACAATQATAQEKSIKEAIIGPWIITAVFDEYQNGEKKDNWGGPVKGQITFGRTGRFTQIIVGPAVASGGPFWGMPVSYHLWGSFVPRRHSQQES